jgi:hypothetical protein
LGAGLGGALAFSLAGGGVALLTPGQARATGVPLRRLSTGEAAILEALGERLAPGAAEAGIAHYVDQQLAAPVQEALLMIRYLGVNPPYEPFYRAGLAALDALARASHHKGFADLETDAADALVGRIAKGAPEGWSGPPAAFFYFVVRADAVDVVYGVKPGFAKLDVPYMAHIEPPARW